MTDIREVVYVVRPLLYTYLTDTKDDGPWVTCLQKLETRAIEMATALIDVPKAMVEAIEKERAAMLELVMKNCNEPAIVAVIDTAIAARATAPTSEPAAGWKILADELAAVFPSEIEKHASGFIPPSLSEIAAGEEAAVDAMMAVLGRS